MQVAPIDRNDRPTLRNTLLALAASFVVAACSGGGAETVENPIPPGGSATTIRQYTGPVARDASVLAFQQEFWANAKNDRPLRLVPQRGCRPVADVRAQR